MMIIMMDYWYLYLTYIIIGLEYQVFLNFYVIYISLWIYK